MNIKLVAFEDGISCIGFRRISSVTKSAYPSAVSYIYNVGGSYALVKNILFQEKLDGLRGYEGIHINSDFIREIGDADVIAFSGMSKFAGHIKKTISLLNLKNKRPVYVWGGIHASVFPEDAIGYADAVCIGEGEKTLLY